MKKPYYAEALQAVNREKGDCSFADWFWPILSILFCTIFMLLCFFAPGNADGPLREPPEEAPAQS